MSAPTAILPAPGWAELIARLDRGTVLVVGAAGTGKTCFSRYLLGQLSRGRDRAADAGAPGTPGKAALVDCDLARASVGVPGCLGLALTTPWEAPAALWFVGATSPVDHLLPAVVGAAHLADRARAAGARAVILDTGNLVEGRRGRELKLHKALATKADQVVAIQRDDELEPLLALLAADGRTVHRLRPSPRARARSAAEDREHRAARFRAHLAGAATRLFAPWRFVGHDWEPWPAGGNGHHGGNGHRPRSDPRSGHQGEQVHRAGHAGSAPPAAGTVVGLLDAAGFCLGLGRLEEVHADRVAVWTAVDRGEVARLQLGAFRLDDDGDERGDETHSATPPDADAAGTAIV